jgi:hypothetical protein
VSCNALSRDTELVKTEPDVRKARKHLLSELGVLASLAKKANSMSHVELTEEVELEIEALGEAIQTRTERLVNRANRLLEIATPLTELWKEEDMYIPPTPPVSGIEFSTETSGMNWEFSASTKGRQGSLSTSGADSLVSVASSLSDDSVTNQHPMSNWALDRLNGTHDILLSHLAGYIGRLHLQSRSPGQIFDTTNQCVTAARNFLGVVRAITNRKGTRLSSTGALEQSSNLLWNKCTTLVNVAREVVSSHGVGEMEDGVVVMDAEVRKLVEAATACVRSAGECVALGHCLLEAMGDFELPVAAAKLNRDSLMSLGSAEEYPGTRRPLSPHKHLSKQLPQPPLSEDNPRRPLPAPPSESHSRKAPPKLKLVSSHVYTIGRGSLTPSSSSAKSGRHPISPSRYSGELSPGDVLKYRDAEAQSRFLGTLHETGSTDTRDPQTQDLESLQGSAKPEIVEPPSSSPTKDSHPGQLSNPQLRGDSLFHSKSDEAARLTDTLTMPRTGSSGSSNLSGEVDVVDEVSMKSVATTPEPGTPVQGTHQLETAQPAKSVILNAEGQVFDP